MNNVELNSNRSFGIVFFIFFLIISLFPLFYGNNIKLFPLTISLIFLILGILNSKILGPLNKLWFMFGILLGRFFSPIIIALIFFSIIVPISFLMKIFNKDILELKFDQKKKTYWKLKPSPKSTMKNQF